MLLPCCYIAALRKYLGNDLDDLLQSVVIFAAVERLAVALVVLGDLVVVRGLVPHPAVGVVGAELGVGLQQDVVEAGALLYHLRNAGPLAQTHFELQLEVLALYVLENGIGLLDFAEVSQDLGLEISTEITFWMPASSMSRTRLMTCSPAKFCWRSMQRSAVSKSSCSMECSVRIFQTLGWLEFLTSSKACVLKVHPWA